MADALPAEAQLLLACARRSVDGDAQAHVAASLARIGDWDRLLQLAERHSLRPQLFKQLAGVPGLPGQFESRLWQHAEQLRARNHVMEGELAAIVGDMEGEGLRVACHKGPVLARLAWGDPGLREYGDLDVLVASEDLERAREVLRRRGFHAKYPLSAAAERALLASPAHYHLMLVHERTGLLVELHWRTDAQFPVEDSADPAWWSSLGRLAIGGRECAILPPRESLLALLIHGSKHHWDSLLWLADVAELLRAATADERSWLLARASAMRVRRRVALGLMLAARHLGPDWPEFTQAWPREQAAMRADAQAIAGRWFQAESDAPGRWQRLGFELRLCDSARQRLRTVVDVVLRPGLEEWSRWPLPPHLFILYVPGRAIRLLAKMVRRTV
jgi:hypothetical protein